MNLTIILLFAGFCVVNKIQFANSASINDSNTLLHDLFSGYNVDVRPVQNQTLPVNVSVMMLAQSITEFDEVNQLFGYVCGLRILWTDERLIWNPVMYGGLTTFAKPLKDVWYPDMVLSNPSDDVEGIASLWNKVRVFANGQVVWLPANKVKSLCAVNIWNYPYDTHVCETSFTAISFIPSEVVFIQSSPTVDMTMFQENGIWEVTDTKTSSHITTTQQSIITFTFHLKRRPAFLIINVILPIQFLGLLNVLVFLLVPESGERISYCLTVLLSIAVFMTIIGDMLPRSSEPVPIISFKLLIDMVISSVIVLVTILNLRIYHREGNKTVPNTLQTMYRFLMCSGRQRQRRTIDVLDDVQVTDKDLPNAKTDGGHPEVSKRSRSPGTSPTPVTWKNVSHMLDWLAFTFFTAASVINSVVCMASVAQ